MFQKNKNNEGFEKKMLVAEGSLRSSRDKYGATFITPF